MQAEVDFYGEDDEEFLEVDFAEPSELIEKRNLLFADLRRNNVTLSHSAFNEFCKSPRHFIQYKMRQKVETPSMAYGTMAHCLVLEPEEFENRFVISPQFDKRTKVGKAGWQEFIAGIQERNERERQRCEATKQPYYDLKVVNQKDYDTANYVKNCIYANDAAAYVLKQITQTEMDVEWEYMGLKWRGKIDGKGERIICDLKFIADADPKKVQRSIKHDGYGRQGVHYKRGARCPKHDYYLIAADRTGNVSVHLMNDAYLHIESKEIDHYIAHFKRCVFQGAWNQSYDFFAPNGIYEIKAW